MGTAMSRPSSACKAILSRRGAIAPGHRHLSPPLKQRVYTSPNDCLPVYRKACGAGFVQRLEQPFAAGEVGRSKSGSWVRTPRLNVVSYYGSRANLQLGCRRGDPCRGWGSFSSAVCESPEARFQTASEAVRSREGGLSRCETV